MPKSYDVNVSTRMGAGFALDLLGAGVVKESHIERDTPSKVLERALTDTLPRLDRLEMTYHLGWVDFGDAPIFTVHSERPFYLDVSPLAALCDPLHEQLGPSLLSIMHELCGHASIFAPMSARDTVAFMYWDGLDDDSELLFRATHELADERGVKPQDVGEEDARVYADSNYLTSNQVAGQFDMRYQRPGTLMLDDCRRCSAGHDALLRLCTLLDKLSESLSSVPPSNEPSDYIDGWPGYCSVLGFRQGERDFVAEMYDEHLQMAQQMGDFLPLYLLELEHEDDFNSLRVALASLKTVFELTDQICATLEELCQPTSKST